MGYIPQDNAFSGACEKIKMTKQQELKKGLKEEFRYLLELEPLNCIPPQAQELWLEEFVNRVLKFEDARGVVIKADENILCPTRTEDCVECLEEECLVAVESLIDDNAT